MAYEYDINMTHNDQLILAQVLNMFGLKQVEVGLRLDKAGGKDVAKMSKDWIHTFGYGMVWHGMA